MEKKRYERGRILTKVVATFLALLMLFATTGTLIYYVVAELMH